MENPREKKVSDSVTKTEKWVKLAVLGGFSKIKASGLVNKPYQNIIRM